MYPGVGFVTPSTLQISVVLLSIVLSCANGLSDQNDVSGAAVPIDKNITGESTSRSGSDWIDIEQRGRRQKATNSRRNVDGNNGVVGYGSPDTPGGDADDVDEVSSDECPPPQPSRPAKSVRRITEFQEDVGKHKRMLREINVRHNLKVRVTIQ